MLSLLGQGDATHRPVGALSPLAEVTALAAAPWAITYSRRAVAAGSIPLMEVAAIVQQAVIPARESLGFRIRSGDQLTVTDVEGQQVGDVFAFSGNDLGEYHSAAHTRAATDRLFPRVGEDFVTNHRRPILRLIDDTSPGRHDLLIPACDAARYAALSARPSHPSCAENLRRTLAASGHTIPVVPQPINVFMDIRIDESGALTWRSASTQPGDHITFEALMDCLVVVSACPQDLVGINGAGPTSLRVSVTSPTFANTTNHGKR